MMANNIPDFFILIIVACVSLSVISDGIGTDDIIHSYVSDMELSDVGFDSSSKTPSNIDNSSTTGASSDTTETTDQSSDTTETTGTSSDTTETTDTSSDTTETTDQSSDTTETTGASSDTTETTDTSSDTTKTTDQGSYTTETTGASSDTTEITDTSSDTTETSDQSSSTTETSDQSSSTTETSDQSSSTTETSDQSSSTTETSDQSSSTTETTDISVSSTTTQSATTTVSSTSTKTTTLVPTESTSGAPQPTTPTPTASITTTTPPQPASTTVSITSTTTQIPTQSTSTTPQSTTTQHPNLNKKEVLDKTEIIIGNINENINEFEEALSDATPATTTTDAAVAIESLNDVREEFIARARHLADLAHIWTEVTDGASMCKDNNTDCKELETTLNEIDQELLFLKDNVDQWNQTRMENLETLSLDLNRSMSNATDPDFINTYIDVTVTQTKLKGISQKAEEAKNAVENEIKNLSDGVIFTAVFGTIGGIIIVSLIAGLAFAVIKGRKSKKTNSKAYKEVREENVPVDGFLHDHDNMAYEEDETAKSRNDAYPLKPFNKPVPPPKDPYSHREERSVDDLYARPSKSKGPGAIPRNYSRAEYDRDHRHNPKPSTSAGDDYYSRPSSSRDDYYSTPQAPQKEKYYDDRGASRPYDDYAAPVSKDPAPRGGLRRFN